MVRPSAQSGGRRRRLRCSGRSCRRPSRPKTWRPWRRAKSVLGYLDGQKVIALSEALEVTRGSINRWLQWYQAMGAEGLRDAERPGRTPRLSEAQKAELATIIEAGPQAAGFTSGMWTGPMIGDLIRRRFGLRYHNHHIPRLLGWMGFSVQRPRKRLARADAEAHRCHPPLARREGGPARFKHRGPVQSGKTGCALLVTDIDVRRGMSHPKGLKLNDSMCNPLTFIRLEIGPYLTELKTNSRQIRAGELHQG